MLNRHGLIAGATGTGKTKTLQIMAGQLSEAGVPCFVADIKGDVTGMAAPGRSGQPERQRSACSRSADVRAVGASGGVPVAVGQARRAGPRDGPLVRAAAAGQGARPQRHADRGPVADLQVLRRQQLPLLDLEDLADDAQVPLVGRWQGRAGRLRRHVPATVGVLLRSIVVLEQYGRRHLLRRARVRRGRPAADDSRRPGHRQHAGAGRRDGQAARSSGRSCSGCWPSCTRRCPRWATCPSPSCASSSTRRTCSSTTRRSALLEEIERTARLIRSKGVGVYFVTQAPTDVPSSVLAQLGNRVQHALRAFTPDDADNLRKTARTFPMTEFYDVEKVLTSLGIGEAAVTVLSPRGMPTPLAATRLIAPNSQMAPIADDRSRPSSPRARCSAKYGATVDRQSAYEMITARIDAAAAAAAQQAARSRPQRRAGVPPTTATGMNTDDARRAAARDPAPGARAARRRAGGRARRRASRQQRTRGRARTQRAPSASASGRSTARSAPASRVATSRLGQDIMRGVFGTLFRR